MVTISPYIKTKGYHENCLAHVLAALNEDNLKVNFKKSEFFKIKVGGQSWIRRESWGEFLGRVLDGATKNMRQESVARTFQLKSCDGHTIRAFLSVAGHFRAFVKDYTENVSACPS